MCYSHTIDIKLISITSGIDFRNLHMIKIGSPWQPMPTINIHDLSDVHLNHNLCRPLARLSTLLSWEVYVFLVFHIHIGLYKYITWLLGQKPWGTSIIGVNPKWPPKMGVDYNFLTNQLTIMCDTSFLHTFDLMNRFLRSILWFWIEFRVKGQVQCHSGHT